MPIRLDQAEAEFEDGFAGFLKARGQAAGDVAPAVADILRRVRGGGDAALRELTLEFDGFDLAESAVAVSPAELDEARAQCGTDELAALELAAGRIRAFHERQVPENLDYTDETGMRLGYRWTPIGAVGMYVPGGSAAYPSSVLMNALPAKVAGVGRLVMAVPAPKGALNPLVLAAARICGVDEILRIGGAQAIGALAHGTETIAPVDKIVGPGNAYVAEAKRQVFGTVGIDLLAGPSEILILADGTCDAAWIAADLLAQAEHDEAAQAILMVSDRAFADEVEAAIETHLETLPRAGIARRGWQDWGAVMIVGSWEQAVPLIDRIAPEHLELAIEAPDDIARRVTNAGAIFLGPHTPEALGDYLAGPNHVLPTGRGARFSSGLGVLDFVKRSSIIGGGIEALRQIGPAAATLARAEGLGAHALSVDLRLAKDGKD